MCYNERIKSLKSWEGKAHGLRTYLGQNGEKMDSNTSTTVYPGSHTASVSNLNKFMTNGTTDHNEQSDTTKPSRGPKGRTINYKSAADFDYIFRMPEEMVEYVELLWSESTAEANLPGKDYMQKLCRFCAHLEGVAGILPGDLGLRPVRRRECNLRNIQEAWHSVQADMERLHSLMPLDQLFTRSSLLPVARHIRRPATLCYGYNQKH